MEIAIPLNVIGGGARVTIPIAMIKVGVCDLKGEWTWILTHRITNSETAIG